jgi:hypothetical protein
MSTEPDIAIVAEGGFEHLREIRQEFLSRGLAAEIVRPPAEQCSS